MSRLLLFVPTLLLAVLVGQITDRTTGQPLAGVRVSVAAGTHTLHATTNSHGRFRLTGVPAGTYVLRYRSADVPLQQTRVEVRAKQSAVRITACSTTLDYNCGAPGGGAGG